MGSSEHEDRVAYCRKHNVHHLFELMASRLLVERPENPFDYLRELLLTVEKSEKRAAHDPTVLPSAPAGEKGGTLTKMTIGTFGIDNAGKTTIISALGGNIDKSSTPTVGFTPTRFQTERCDLCVFDLGGGANFRGIWVHYYHDCHGFMFVIDSAADEAVVEESLNALRSVAQHKYVRGKPILLLANKKDLMNSRGVEVVPKGLLDELFGGVSLFRLVPSCGIEEDPELEKGVDWLLTAVEKDYGRISKLVEEQTLEVKMQAEQRRKKLFED